MYSWVVMSNLEKKNERDGDGKWAGQAWGCNLIS